MKRTALRVVMCASAGGAAAGLVACGVLSGADDLSFRECLSGCEAEGGAEASAGDSAGDSADGTIAPVIDASPPPPDAAGVPSFCVGLVAVIPFDQSAAVFNRPGLKDAGAFDLDPGKYGQSFDIGPSSFAEYDVGASAIPLSLDEGTIAFWIQADSDACAPVKTYVQTLPVGPAVTCDSPLAARIQGATPQTTAAIVDAGSLRSGFNHVVTTWTQAPADGRASLTLALNGAPSAVMATAPWSVAGAVATLRVGQLPPTAVGRMDDLAVWVRALTLAEQAAIAASPVSVIDACRLR